MSLLYRMLMRLAAAVLVLTLTWNVALLIGSGSAGLDLLHWLAFLVLIFGPPGLIAAVAWVVKPPTGGSKLRSDRF